MKNIALLLAALLLGSCYRYWRNADRFQSELKCGQSADQILALASKYGAERHWTPTDHYLEGDPHLYVRQHSTVFHFWLSDDKLEAFRQNKYHGTTSLRPSLRVNLCTGEKTGYPMLDVMAPEELKSAALSLNGKPLHQLSTGEGLAHASIGLPMLPFGQHEIEIEKSGFAPIRRQFIYAPKDFWPEPEEIQFTIEPDEVKRLP